MLSDDGEEDQCRMQKTSAMTGDGDGRNKGCCDCRKKVVEMNLEM